MSSRFFDANHPKTAKTLTERIPSGMQSQKPTLAASSTPPLESHRLDRWIVRALWLSSSALLVLSFQCFATDAPTQAESQNGEDNPFVDKPASEPSDRPLLGSVLRVSFEEDKQLRTTTGELVAIDSKMGQLILDSDGQLTAIAPKDLKRVDELTDKLVPTPAKELAAKVLKIMPPGSRSIVKEHFVVCYNTSDVYAYWNAELYEKLYKGFYRFWKEKGVELNAPRFPLVALIFETQADYIQFAAKEFAGAQNTIGYYHQSTNRLASYDLTGIQGLIPPKAQVMRTELINQIVSRPEGERLIATIIHEVCHQLSFNSGLQVRLGDNPLWVSEGLATFFETPDLSSQNGWGGIGKLNKHNYVNLANYLPSRTNESLELLLLDDNRLRNGDTMASSYAEAWGLTYYLLKSKPKQFASYLESLRKKPPGSRSNPKERIELFRECFGEDLKKIDRDFIRLMQNQNLR